MELERIFGDINNLNLALKSTDESVKWQTLSDLRGQLVFYATDPEFQQQLSQAYTSGRVIIERNDSDVVLHALDQFGLRLDAVATSMKAGWPPPSATDNLREVAKLLPRSRQSLNPPSPAEITQKIQAVATEIESLLRRSRSGIGRLLQAALSQVQSLLIRMAAISTATIEIGGDLVLMQDWSWSSVR